MSSDIRDKLHIIKGKRKRYRIPNPPNGSTFYINDDSEYLTKIISIQRKVFIALFICELYLILAFTICYSQQREKITQLEQQNHQLENLLQDISD